MRIIKFGILLAATCQAQISFVPRYPGNWTPTTPIFGVLYGSAGDTIFDRNIKNVGSASIVLQAVSMEILSPGLEGEWRGSFSVQGMDIAIFEAQRVQFKKFHYTQLNPPAIAPDSTAYLSVNRLADCYWPCTVDKSVTPPDTLFKHNTVNPVDTFDVRLGVYWRVGNIYDSAYLDCRIEYRTGMHTEGIQYRGSSPGVARPVGVSGGWRVESGAWSLRHTDGREVPVGRLATAQGLVVRPTQAFEGIGILHNAEGQAFRVVGVR
jgi:hypothetical protein